MKCAFYEKEITPPLYDDIPGYYANRITTDVEDKLYAKAVVFEDDGKYCAMLTIDCVCVHLSLCEEIRDRICEHTDIPREAIAVISNHSHYGIPIGDTVSPADEEFMKVFKKLAADTVILAYLRLKPCTLSYVLGQKENVAFVRDCIMSDGSVLTNPSSKLEIKPVKTYTQPDNDLPVLCVKDTVGNIMGVVFTFALHQDTTGSTRAGLDPAYSGDYSSEISYRLKNEYGNECVSVYLPGFCGDINHLDFIGGKKQNHRTIGKELADAIIELVPKTQPVTENGVEARFQTVNITRRRATKEQIERAEYVVVDRYARRNASDPCGGVLYEELLKYEQKAKDLSATMEMPVQYFNIGGVSVFISPCEMYSAYSKPLKELAQNGKWLISELANFESSYVFTTDLENSSVYPAQLCYGSHLEVQAGNKIVQAFKEIVK